MSENKPEDNKNIVDENIEETTDNESKSNENENTKIDSSTDQNSNLNPIKTMNNTLYHSLQFQLLTMLNWRPLRRLLLMVMSLK